jgi:SAM-dependent methyltransferase
VSKGFLRKLLETPVVYSLVQNIALPGQNKLLGARLDNIFRCSKGLVLDVGCGPKPIAPVPEGTLVGIDINPEYIRKYTGGCIDTDMHVIHDGRKSVYGFIGIAEKLPFADGAFDECRCFGVLHHLPTASARTAVMEMRRCVRPGGKIVIFDSVMPRSVFFRPLAWMIRKCDRGEWVRNEDELVDLIRSAGKEEWMSSRFTYTYNGLEGMIFVAAKTQGKC